MKSYLREEKREDYVTRCLAVMTVIMAVTGLAIFVFVINNYL